MSSRPGLASETTTWATCCARRAGWRTHPVALTLTLTPGLTLTLSLSLSLSLARTQPSPNKPNPNPDQGATAGGQPAASLCCRASLHGADGLPRESGVSTYHPPCLPTYSFTNVPTILRVQGGAVNEAKLPITYRLLLPTTYLLLPTTNHYLLGGMTRRRCISVRMPWSTWASTPRRRSALLPTTA